MRFLSRFLRDTRAVALIEFAIVFPVIMIMLLGGLEVSRAMVITQRAEKAGYVLADIASQYPPATKDRVAGEISETELRTNVFPQMQRVMGTYGAAEKQAVILTSVRREGALRKIKWQAAGGGTLTSNVTSIVNGLAPGSIGAGVKDSTANFSGATGDTATLVSQMADQENMIVAEVFFQYQPIWAQVIGAIPVDRETGATATIARPKVLVKRMYFRPRHGDLACLPDTFVYPDCQ